MRTVFKAEILVPAENVKVRLDLSGLVQNLSGWEVKLLSPDTAQPQFADLSLHGSVAELTLGRIEHYSVVTLSARAVLPSRSLSDRNSRRKH